MDKMILAYRPRQIQGKRKLFGLLMGYLTTIIAVLAVLAFGTEQVWANDSAQGGFTPSQDMMDQAHQTSVQDHGEIQQNVTNARGDLNRALNGVEDSTKAKMDDEDNGCSIQAGSSHDQRQQYCKAAKSADEGAKKEKVIGAAWAATASVCGGACGLAITCAALVTNPATAPACAIALPISETTCNYGSLATTVADVVTTQQYQGLMMTVMGQGMSLATNTEGYVNSMTFQNIGSTNPASAIAGVSDSAAIDKIANLQSIAANDPSSLNAVQTKILDAAGPIDAADFTQLAPGEPPPFNQTAMDGAKMEVANENAAQEAKDKIAGSCMSFAMATAQAASKFNGAKSQTSEAQNLRQKAKKLNSTQTSVAMASRAPNADRDRQRGGSPDQGNGSAESAVSKADKNCGQAIASGSGFAMAQCAVASDSNLPPQLTDSKFNDTLKKLTNLDVNDFMQNREQDPADQIGNALGNLLGPKMGQEVAAAAKDISKDLAAKQNQMLADKGAVPSSGRRGGRGGKKTDYMGQMNQMLDKMMSGLQGKDEKKERKPAGADSKVFKLSKMTADQITNDRNISLFTRIDFRYKKAQSRMVALPYVSPYNRHMNRGIANHRPPNSKQQLTSSSKTSSRAKRRNSYHKF